MDDPACDCCEGTQVLTPVTVANRPGLAALAYRVGTHASFFETMKANLSSQIVEAPRAGDPTHSDITYPLRSLATRASDDPAIALLDGWATVADVLTFYQERIANEGYLRTATERRSILELGRLVNYALRPGVAATVYLAYTIDMNQTTPVEIPIGARSQSLPGPGELPQSFEASDVLDARAGWNTLNPRLTQPQTIDSINRNGCVYLKGITTNLRPNDALLIVWAGKPVLFRVKEVKPDAAAGRTRIVFQSTAGLRPTMELAATAKPAAAASSSGAPAGETYADVQRNYAQALAEIAARYSDPNEIKQTFKVDTASDMAGRVLQTLADLRAQAAVDMPPEQRAELLQNTTMARLRQELITAANAGYTRLESWISAIVSDLDQVTANTLAAVANVAPSEEGVARMTQTVRKSEDPLLNVIQGLSRPPSVPPANTLQLIRSVKNSFVAVNGLNDSGLQVVNALRPDFKASLPVALSNVQVTPASPLEVYALRLKTGVYGSTAPPQASADWPIAITSHKVIPLDGIYDSVAPQTYYVVQRPGQNDVIGIILNAQTIAETAYNFPARVTQLTLDQDWLTPDDKLLSDIRSTTVFAQSEKLELAEEPITDEICGGASDEIELDGLYSDLKSGRWLIVAGNRSDIQDTSNNVIANLATAELVMLARVRHGYHPDLPGDKTHTFITLAAKLSYCYQRDQVTIYGNVVKATHGETRNEVLGSGDGSRALQSFDLKQPPLTYVAAPNPSGVDSTLQVYVNDVEWHAADTLAGLAPTDHKFITRTNDAGTATVIFGNGQQGARLPTGMANVRAVYRNGIGQPGNVQARQVSLLVTRPLGVKNVINPLRASGGADEESRDQARKNVPLAVAALDRLVSVQDYADFTRTFAGIAKASARPLPDRKRELVHITIAGVDDVPIDPSSDLYRNLLTALHAYGDPDLPVQVDLRELLMLVVSAKVYLQADYLWEKVVTEVRARLLNAFSFDRRDLGQDAVLSEVLAVIQAAPGVAYVDVELFDAIPEKITDATTGQRRLRTPNEITAIVQGMAPPPRDRVRAGLADNSTGVLQAAQLAFLTPLVPDTLILNRG